MSSPKDTELSATIREELFTCVVGEVMDSMAEMRRYLPAGIRPVSEGIPTREAWGTHGIM